MHRTILTKAQEELLPFVKAFAPQFYLVGGTAIALHLGHRESIDFDLFTNKKIDKNMVMRTTLKHDLEYVVSYQDGDQITGKINGVQVTFYEYPFPVEANIDFENIIAMPDLLNLAAMKAYAIGQRAKWKDYVDLYFIFKDHYSLDDVAQKAEMIFKGWFNRKLFREQISFFEDINYREKVVYLGKPVPDEEVKAFLIDVATQPF